MRSRRYTALRVTWCALLAIAVPLICASCTDLKRVAYQDGTAQQLLGHEIRVTTVSGQQYDFLLLAVTEDELVGESTRVLLDRVAMVERHDLSVWKTACLAGGGLLAALAVAFFIALANWEGP